MLIDSRIKNWRYDVKISLSCFIGVLSHLMLFPNGWAAEYTGQITVFQNSKPVVVQVNLPTINNGGLENDVVRFSELPSTIVPDRNRCFCFGDNDERTAFVTAFFQINKELEYFNNLLVKMGYPPVPGVKVTMVKKNHPTEGSASLKYGITVSYSSWIVDPGTLAHEVGHWIHQNLIGADSLPFKKGGQSNSLNSAIAEKSGIEEGTANILAAWFLGKSRIHEATFPEWRFDIDTFVRFPDLVISTKNMLIDLLSISRIKEQYPDYYKGVEDLMVLANKDANLMDYLSQPDPYLSSAIINQPLWHASQLYDHNEVISIYLRAISKLKSASAYSDLADQILIETRSLPHIADYLVVQFKLRGLTLSL